MGKNRQFNRPNTVIDEACTLTEAEIEEVLETSEVKIEEAKEMIEAEEVIEEQPATIIGRVTGCKKLNIRVAPTIESTALCVVVENSELVINPLCSTEDWYNVHTTAGVDGYCMKKYVTV